jgi:hypothetical protein
VPAKSAVEPAVAKLTVTAVGPAGRELPVLILHHVPPAKIVHVPTVAPTREMVTGMSVAIGAGIYGCSVPPVTGT